MNRNQPHLPPIVSLPLLRCVVDLLLTCTLANVTTASVLLSCLCVSLFQYDAAIELSLFRAWGPGKAPFGLRGSTPN